MASFAFLPGSQGIAAPPTVYDRARFMSGFPLKTYSKPFAKRLPTGLTITANNDFIIADYAGKSIKVFNRMGQLKTEFGCGKLVNPWSVAQLGTGEIVVSDPGDKDIKLFSMQGDFIKSFQSTDKLTEPYGLAVNASGEVLVTDKGSNCVLIYKEDGSFLRVVAPPDHVTFTWPQYITVDHRNNMVISDCGSHSVYGLDNSGRVLFKYGNQGSGQGQVSYPQGVCVDRHGHVILADSGNNRMQLLSAEGRFQQCLLTAREGIEKPAAIATDTEGHLVFTESTTGELKSYLYLT